MSEQEPNKASADRPQCAGKEQGTAAAQSPTGQPPTGGSSHGAEGQPYRYVNGPPMPEQASADIRADPRAAPAWGYGQPSHHQAAFGPATNSPAYPHGYGPYPYGYPHPPPFYAQPPAGMPAQGHWPPQPQFSAAPPAGTASAGQPGGGSGGAGPGPGPGPQAGMQELLEEIAGGGNGLTSLTRMLSLDDTEFWKGALVGAAAALLLTNDQVQDVLFKAGAKAKSAAKRGADGLKERASNAARAGASADSGPDTKPADP